MTKFFREYVWKEGIPYGVHEINGEPIGSSYKIVMDPYRKRISIENYLDGMFSHIVYDSYLINFRHLSPAEQTAWQKEELPSGTVLIRNQDDRIVFKENYVFEGDCCRECHVTSPHGIPLSTHKMFYKKLGDGFNGVILYDKNNRQVMKKEYAVDDVSGEFTELLSEDWNLEN